MTEKLVHTMAAPADAVLDDEQTDEEFTEEQIALDMSAFPSAVIKRGLSPAFGRPDKRRAQLVARLKRRRKYANPVKGGTGRHKRKSGRGHF